MLKRPAVRMDILLPAQDPQVKTCREGAGICSQRELEKAKRVGGCDQPVVNGSQHRGYVNARGYGGVCHIQRHGAWKKTLKNLPNLQPLNGVHVATLAQPIEPQLIIAIVEEIESGPAAVGDSLQAAQGQPHVPGKGRQLLGVPVARDASRGRSQAAVTKPPKSIDRVGIHSVSTRIKSGGVLVQQSWVGPPGRRQRVRVIPLVFLLGARLLPRPAARFPTRSGKQLLCAPYM